VTHHDAAQQKQEVSKDTFIATVCCVSSTPPVILLSSVIRVRKYCRRKYSEHFVNVLNPNKLQLIA